MSVCDPTCSMKVSVESGVWSITDKLGKERTMTLLHEALEFVVTPLRKCDLKGLVMKTRRRMERKNKPLLVSYCCVVLHRKDI